MKRRKRERKERKSVYQYGCRTQAAWTNRGKERNGKYGEESKREDIKNVSKYERQESKLE